MSRFSGVLFIATALTIICAGPLILEILYKRGMRRCRRHIKASYSAKLEERAWIARSLNENLALAMQRSQSTVNAMGARPADALAMKMGFNQIAQWLDVAAEEADTALRSLETSSGESRKYGNEGKEQWTRSSKSP